MPMTVLGLESESIGLLGMKDSSFARQRETAAGSEMFRFPSIMQCVVDLRSGILQAETMTCHSNNSIEIPKFSSTLK
jgi:hypothetical protein